MKRRFEKLLGFLILTLTLEAAIGNSNLWALLYEGFPTTKESQAYHEFIKRSNSEHSKLLYLIDRFGDANVEIVYDGHYYSAPFVARVARWFISRNYRKEPAEKWLMRWCNTSIVTGNLIWVKLPTGKFRLAREVLLDELRALDAQMKVDEEGLLKKKQVQVEADSPIDSTALPPAAIPRLVAGAPSPKS